MHGFPPFTLIPLWPAATREELGREVQGADPCPVTVVLAAFVGQETGGAG